MCQDPNLFLPEADSKDLVVPVWDSYNGLWW